MKLLLLTDIPPNKKLTAGLVLDRLCRFLPPGSISCFAVVNPTIDVTMSDDIPGASVHYVDKPREDGFRSLASAPPLRFAAEFVRGEIDRNTTIPELVRKAARFGRAQKVDAVWAILQGQTIIHMADPLARTLGVPLFTMVWDPLSWWLKANDVDRVTSTKALRQFDKTIEASRACATASWAMSEAYDRRYKIYTIPVISSHDASVARAPEPRMNDEGKIVIGMAGQFYAIDAWDQLVAALNACQWRIAGREVTIRVAGHYAPDSAIPPGRMEMLGWLKQDELIGKMAECDLLYCPYPFAAELDEVSRLSFPSKLVTYLAAGRPTIFHGPAQASPARYVERHGVGLVASQPFASSIYNAIDRLAKDPELYRRSATNACESFRRDFTYDRMRENFFRYLRIAPHELDWRSRSVAPVTIDERNPSIRRRRLKSGGTRSATAPASLVMSLPIMRGVRAQLAELTEWQRVHTIELGNLYAYIKTLQVDIASRANALEAARIPGIEGEPREIVDRLLHDIAIRDRTAASLIKQLSETRARSHAKTDALLAALRLLGAQARKLPETTAALDAARSEITAAEDRIENLNAALAQSHHALARVAAKDDALEGAQAFWTGRISSLEDQLVDERHLRTAALDRVRILEAALAEARTHAARNATERDDIATRRYNETLALGESLEMLRAERSAVEVALRGAQTEIARLQTQLAAMQMTLIDAGRERDEARQRLYYESLDANRRAAHFEASLGEAHQQTDETLSRILAKVSNLEYDVANRLERRGGGGGDAYLDLLEASLTGRLSPDADLLSGASYNPTKREIGRDRPAHALTMIGVARMRNIRRLAEDIIAHGIEGDFIETGVWRGGACIYMRGILKAYGDVARTVWVADSFAGLPPPNDTLYPADRGDLHHLAKDLAISAADVRDSFARYGLLDEQVKFLEGWFKDTLPGAPIERLALLRLDGDMYESTIQALDALYDKLSVGGYLIVDDYTLPGCRKAIDDFRAKRGISDVVEEIDGSSAFWKKSNVAMLAPGSRAR